jgi:hypothetical protein
VTASLQAAVGNAITATTGLPASAQLSASAQQAMVEQLALQLQADLAASSNLVSQVLAQLGATAALSPAAGLVFTNAVTLAVASLLTSADSLSSGSGPTLIRWLAEALRTPTV